ncbi:type ISP restriction/modification enzyme [Candidatus Poriferisodalis sp.]|uniref:type ISP restriction/modification enzyme n=1 Tax=Candidatus Poriferisodalis sp. TaxID=3101277 RepID=UPI003B018D5C
MLAYQPRTGRLGTAAFSERYGAQLAEAAGPVRIPITADVALFSEAVDLGRDLLWWHTSGERFAPTPGARLPAGSAKEVAPVTAMPESLKDCRYDPDAEQLTVATGIFALVSPAVWDFEVSGLRVLRSWLGYRMKNRKGRKCSELDNIRPHRWTQSAELLLVLSILEHTVEVTPRAADLLDRIVNGPLIPAADLPKPTEAQRKPPKP